MSKSKERTKQTHEVFTPTPIVNEMLDKIPQEVFESSTTTFFDPAMGGGQFLRLGVKMSVDYLVELLTFEEMVFTHDEIQRCFDGSYFNVTSLRKTIIKKFFSIESAKIGWDRLMKIDSDLSFGSMDSNVERFNERIDNGTIIDINPFIRIYQDNPLAWYLEFKKS